MPNHDAQATRFNGEERGLGVSNVSRLHPVWMLPITTGPAPVASGTHVFAPIDEEMGGNDRGSLGLALQDGPSGQTVRRLSMAAMLFPQHDVLETLAFANGKLIVSDIGDPLARPVHPQTLVALDVRTGRPVWRIPMRTNWVTVAGTTLYTGFDTSSAIDLGTGRVLWRHRGNFDAPVLVAGRLYQTERAGTTTRMRVYAPRTGRLIATRTGLSNAALTGDAHNVYAIQSDFGRRSWLGRMSTGGRPTWRVDLGSLRFSAQPVLAYHNLYVPSDRKGTGVLAVNAANGRIRWEAPIGPNVAVVAANHLLFALHRPGLHPNPRLDGHVDVLDAATGRIVARLNMTPYLQRYGLTTAALGDLAISGGTLFLFDHNVCIALHP